MSKLTLPLFLFLLVIWLMGATWWFNNKYDQLDQYEGQTCVIPFTVEDGNFQTKSENTIIFEPSNWEPIIPMQTLASLKSVALYLANNNEKKLVLKGWFGKNESNNSDFRNNGIARAEAIKRELITYGAPTEKIQIEADSSEIIELKCGKILGGVDFEFITNNSIAQNNPAPITPPKEEVIQKNNNTNTNLENSFDAKKIYMIFYAENNFKPEINEEIDLYFKSLTKYLKEHPKDRLLLLGHTDNVGDSNKHFNYGKYRARKLRDVLLEYGIEKRRIKTDSKGSSKPLDSNDTSEGRYQNRRVEISIVER